MSPPKWYSVLCALLIKMSPVELPDSCWNSFWVRAPGADAGISHAKQAGYLSTEFIVIHKTIVAYSNPAMLLSSRESKISLLFFWSVWKQKPHLPFDITQGHTKICPTHLHHHGRWVGFVFLSVFTLILTLIVLLFNPSSYSLTSFLFPFRLDEEAKLMMPLSQPLLEGADTQNALNFKVWS